MNLTLVDLLTRFAGLEPEVAAAAVAELLRVGVPPESLPAAVSDILNTCATRRQDLAEVELATHYGPDLVRLLLEQGPAYALSPVWASRALNQLRNALPLDTVTVPVNSHGGTVSVAWPPVAADREAARTFAQLRAAEREQLAAMSWNPELSRDPGLRLDGAGDQLGTLGAALPFTVAPAEPRSPFTVAPAEPRPPWTGGSVTSSDFGGSVLGVMNQPTDDSPATAYMVFDRRLLDCAGYRILAYALYVVDLHQAGHRVGLVVSDTDWQVVNDTLAMDLLRAVIAGGDTAPLVDRLIDVAPEIMERARTP